MNRGRIVGPTAMSLKLYTPSMVGGVEFVGVVAWPGTAGGASFSSGNSKLNTERWMPFLLVVSEPDIVCSSMRVSKDLRVIGTTTTHLWSLAV